MGREPSIGAVYTALERLERKGMVSSQWGEATEERGGRRKRLYRVEAKGELAARRFATRFSGFGSALGELTARCLARFSSLGSASGLEVAP